MLQEHEGDEVKVVKTRRTKMRGILRTQALTLNEEGNY